MSATVGKIKTAMLKKGVYDLRRRTKTTINAGNLNVFDILYINPGDRIRPTENQFLVRTQTIKRPTMDNAFLDVYAFYVRWRDIWNDYAEFLGENDQGPWYQPDDEVTIPIIDGYSGHTGGQSETTTLRGFYSGENYDNGHLAFAHAERTLAHQIGMPIRLMDKTAGDTATVAYTLFSGSSTNDHINKIAINAYLKIWNDFFMNQNYSSPMQIDKTSTNLHVLNMTAGTSLTLNEAMQYGFNLLPMAKTENYFTRILPDAQKGEAVQIPYLIDELAPVITSFPFHDVTGTRPQMYFQRGDGTTNADAALAGEALAFTTGTQDENGNWANPLVPTQGQTNVVDISTNVFPINLYADLQNQETGTINALRLAWGKQRLLENQARGGTRLIEIMKNSFGVTDTDLMYNRAEYICGARIPLGQMEIAQTSESSDNSPQGTLGAYGVTKDKFVIPSKAFTEHGYLLIVGGVRTNQTYGDGVERMLQLQDKYSIFWPELENIGEEPIMASEYNAMDDRAYGYLPAYEWLRQRFDVARGQMAPDLPDFQIWTYGNTFETNIDIDGGANIMTLYESFQNFDQTLFASAVDVRGTGNVMVTAGVDHFRIDSYTGVIVERCIKPFGIPEDVDHVGVIK